MIKAFEAKQISLDSEAEADKVLEDIGICITDAAHKGKRSLSYYKGKRVKRGLFISNKGVTINADINGSLNILRKVVKNNDMLDLIESQQWAKQSPIRICM